MRFAAQGFAALLSGNSIKNVYPSRLISAKVFEYFFVNYCFL